MCIAKRTGGALDRDGNWHVLTEESTKDETGWTHRCGESVMNAVVILSHRDGVSTLSGSGETQRLDVPYCPACERKPLAGVFGPGVSNECGFAINHWEKE